LPASFGLISAPSLGTGNVAGFAQEVGRSGEAAALLADILEVFQFTFAVMLGMGSLVPAISAGHGLAGRIAEVAGLIRQGPAGFTGINFFHHNSSLKAVKLVIAKNKVEMRRVNPGDRIFSGQLTRGPGRGVSGFRFLVKNNALDTCIFA
jgi:hypothetical protein